MAVDVGKTAVDAVLADGELFVVDAEKVEDGGVEIVAIGGAFGSLVTPVVASTVGGAGLDAGSGHP